MEVCSITNCLYNGFLGDIPQVCLKTLIKNEETWANVPNKYIPPCEHSEVNEELLEE